MEHLNVYTDRVRAASAGQENMPLTDLSFNWLLLLLRRITGGACWTSPSTSFSRVSVVPLSNRMFVLSRETPAPVVAEGTTIRVCYITPVAFFLFAIFCWVS